MLFSYTEGKNLIKNLMVELAWQMQSRMMCDIWNFDLSWGLTPSQLGLVESPLICNTADCRSARLMASTRISSNNNHHYDYVCRARYVKLWRCWRRSQLGVIKTCWC